MAGRRKRILAFTLIEVILVTAMFSAASGSLSNTSKGVLMQLEQDLLQGKIKSIRVLFMPYEMRTRTRVTPTLLESSAYFNSIVNMDSSIQGSLLSAIKTCWVKPASSEPDLRWGAIFMNKNGEKIHSVYISGKSLFAKGRHGIIDGRVVNLNGSFISWFEANFPEAMTKGRK